MSSRRAESTTVEADLRVLDYSAGFPGAAAIKAAKYRVAGGTGNWANRRLFVWAP